MKHFQKTIIYLIIFLIISLLKYVDAFPQNDSLVKNDSLIIGGLFKITLITGEETFGEIKSCDSISIKLTFNGITIGIKRNKIKSIEEYTYILRLSMGKKDKEKSTVILNDGTFYRGRLLSLSLIRKNELNKYEDIKTNHNILEVEKDEIYRVIIYGSSNALSGLGYGALIGTGLGAIIGFADGDEPSGFIRLTAEAKAILLGITLGLVGGVVGLTVGLISSTPDEIIEINSDNDYDQLKKYIGHPLEENSKQNDYK